MKLAEALAERSGCQARLADLKNRLERTARVSLIFSYCSAVILINIIMPE
jgi:hypothetical protein